ncbi:olfactory receptor 8U3-like [Brachyistius frenatus]|uniref:olfactory receptor 8U3-like n=1 Tax=Brachyistius frenatus TaxID=100188 RepID=UPI0037E8BF46
MLNSTSFSFSYFILQAYMNVGSLKYMYFVITALLYAVIVAVNVFLLVVICVNRSLHEPMYLFLCSLLVNELYGSSGLFPFLLLQILSDVHTVPAAFCFLQVFCLYTYVNVEFCNLAVMSYDRYVAICCPLQYNTRMSSNKVLCLVVWIWLYSFGKFLITFSLNIRFTRCGNVLDSTHCRNYLLVKLACGDTRINNFYGLFAIVVSILILLIPVLFSYIKILQVLQSRFDMSRLPNMLRILLSLYFIVLQPLLNPIMYGVQMTKIRNACKDMFWRKMFSDHRQHMK